MHVITIDLNDDRKFKKPQCFSSSGRFLSILIWSDYYDDFFLFVRNFYSSKIKRPNFIYKPYQMEKNQSKKTQAISCKNYNDN